MLVLSRKLHEKIVFPGLGASVEVVGMKGNAVRLGVQAPPEMIVLREELQGATSAAGRAEASRPKEADAQARELNHFINNRLNAAVIGLALLRKQAEQGLTDQMGGAIQRIEREIEALRQRFGGPAPATAPAKKPEKQRKACKALLVEDDQNERELLAAYLRMAGMDVDTAGDGVDALDYLRTRGKPDVVLMDMALPRCDGPTAIRAIRNDPAIADLKIFAVTGQPPARFGLEDDGRGVDRWFRKPLDAASLLRDLRHDVTGEE